MKCKNKWFTIVELVISMSILWIIILWISFSLVRISENLSDANLKWNIFSDIKEFLYDSYFFNYNSWKILSWSLLLYNDKTWIIIWNFLDENNWYDYQIISNDLVYNKGYLWYFKVNENILPNILNNSINVLSLSFNDGKIFKNILLKNFEIIPYNSERIFEINIEVFKNPMKNYFWQNKSDLFIPKNDYLKFNFNF